MPSRSASRVAARYRERVARIRALVDTRIIALYGDTIDPAAIDASFARFIDLIEPLIAAGQASVAVTAAAAVRSIALAERDELLEVDPDEDAIAGTTREGRSLRDGMAAWGPMVLGQIAAGRSADEALEYGSYLVSRFADSELTGAGDRELEHQGREIGPLSGWEGIVQPDACDPCQENAGVHELTWSAYRHAHCACVVVPVFG